MTEMVQRLDDLGRPAWIAIMVLGFIVFWPVGLATLAFLIWSGRMGCGRHGDMGRSGMGRWQQHMGERFESKMRRWREFATDRVPPSGNRAFDEYREATLRRLEEEAHEFRAFLDQLRMAKDRAEFDQFMNGRRNGSTGNTGSVPPTSPAGPPTT
jgi:hypothetical protein